MNLGRQHPFRHTKVTRQEGIGDTRMIVKTLFQKHGPSQGLTSQWPRDIGNVMTTSKDSGKSLRVDLLLSSSSSSSSSLLVCGWQVSANQGNGIIPRYCCRSVGIEALKRVSILLDDDHHHPLDCNNSIGTVDGPPGDEWSQSC